MAQSELIKKLVVVEVEKEFIQMTLDMDEVTALRDVLGRVGGCPNSRRAFIDNIFYTLEGKVPYRNWEDKSDLVVKNDNLWFKSPEELR